MKFKISEKVKKLLKKYPNADPLIDIIVKRQAEAVLRIEQEALKNAYGYLIENARSIEEDLDHENEYSQDIKEEK